MLIRNSLIAISVFAVSCLLFGISAFANSSPSVKQQFNDIFSQAHSADAMLSIDDTLDLNRDVALKILLKEFSYDAGNCSLTFELVNQEGEPAAIRYVYPLSDNFYLSLNFFGQLAEGRFSLTLSQGSDAGQHLSWIFADLKTRKKAKVMVQAMIARCRKSGNDLPQISWTPLISASRTTEVIYGDTNTLRG